MGDWGWRLVITALGWVYYTIVRYIINDIFLFIGDCISRSVPRLRKCNQSIWAVCGKNTTKYRLDGQKSWKDFFLAAGCLIATTPTPKRTTTGYLRRCCTLKTLAALQRMRLIIQTTLLGSYMCKSACSVVRVSIGLLAEDKQHNNN